MTQYRDAHLMYLGEDIFRMKPADETLKQITTFIRYAAHDTSITTHVHRVQPI